MNVYDYILIAVIAALIVFAVISIKRQHKSGRGCCGGCSGCCMNCQKNCSSRKEIH